MGQGAVDLLADPSVLAVDEIVDGHSAGQDHLGEVAQHVVGVGGGQARVALGLQFAVGGVGVAVGPIGEQAVLGVMGAAGSVAVGVIAVGGCRDAIGLDLGQAPGQVIGVVVGGGGACDGLLLLGDAPQFVSCVGRAVEGGCAMGGRIVCGLAKGVVAQTG